MVDFYWQTCKIFTHKGYQIQVYIGLGMRYYLVILKDSNTVLSRKIDQSDANSWLHLDINGVHRLGVWMIDAVFEYGNGNCLAKLVE